MPQAASLFAVSPAVHPNPGDGETASNSVLHSSGATLKAPQIAFSRDMESLPACAFTPLIISVGEPPIWYFSFSTLWISNLGNFPLNHEASSSRFAITLNASSVASTQADRVALFIFISSMQLAPSPAPRKQIR